jgi:hypothetical protein
MSAAAEEDTTNNTHSTATFLSALVTGLVTFAVYTFLFWLLHSRFQKVYQPRTLLAPERSVTLLDIHSLSES